MKPFSKARRRLTLYSSVKKTATRDLKEHLKNQENVTPDEPINFSVASPKEMKMYKLPDKEWKIIVLRKLRELQEKTDKITQ